jgi:hypothetical protein
MSTVWYVIYDILIDYSYKIQPDQSSWELNDFLLRSVWSSDPYTIYSVTVFTLPPLPGQCRNGIYGVCCIAGEAVKEVLGKLTSFREKPQLKYILFKEQLFKGFIFLPNINNVKQKTKSREKGYKKSIIFF